MHKVHLMSIFCRCAFKNSTNAALSSPFALREPAQSPSRATGSGVRSGFGSGGVLPDREARVNQREHTFSALPSPKSLKVGGLRAGRASRNRVLPVGGSVSRNHELRDASLRCQGALRNQRGV